MAEESMRTEITTVHGEIREGFARVDAKFAEMNGKMDAGFERVDREIATLRGEMHEGFARVDAKIERAIKTLLYAIVSIGGAIVLGMITALIRLWTMQ